jgi:hypothetical protein
MVDLHLFLQRERLFTQPLAWLDLKRSTRLLDMDSMFISNEIQSRPLSCFGVI